MSKLKIIIIIIVVLIISSGIYLLSFRINPDNKITTSKIFSVNQGGQETQIHPLSIEYMRQQEYPGSPITIEQTLDRASNYSRYLASYKSDGLKIFALLTIPLGDKPDSGWPVIIFNHGYIQPEVYRTTERYEAYVDTFARKGYIVFKPDYRGHGDSEGRPEGAYFSPAYTIDVLNALASIKQHPDSNPERIGMWGHSMGGHIVLRSMVVSDDIKAGVIWAGVAVSYKDMTDNWRRSRPWSPSQRENMARRPSRQNLLDQFGDYDENGSFWESISPISFVADISGPIQLHHGIQDQTVPIVFSEILNDKLKEAGKEVEFYTYQGDDHNISSSFSQAAQRSVEFFDKYLK